MAEDGLDRFLAAQASCFDAVVAELARGRKETHWMWFVFPQLRGLGQSERAQFYGLGGAKEARTYVAHPILGPRLRASAELVMTHTGRRSAPQIMGQADALKLRSCATLFSHAAPEVPVFAALTRAFYGGTACDRTIEMLAS